MATTISVKKEDVPRQWYVVSAAGQPLGRLAARVAAVLRGKHKPIYTPHVDCGDFVIVTDAAEVALTGRKRVQKYWYRHSGYPGGLKATRYRRLLRERPGEAIRKAVVGMLPKNRLGRQMIRKLRIYEGSEHQHEAQQPQPLP